MSSLLRQEREAVLTLQRSWMDALETVRTRPARRTRRTGVAGCRILETCGWEWLLGLRCAHSPRLHQLPPVVGLRIVRGARRSNARFSNESRQCGEMLPSWVSIFCRWNASVSPSRRKDSIRSLSYCLFETAASTRCTAQTMSAGSSLVTACVVWLDITRVPRDEAKVHS